MDSQADAVTRALGASDPFPDLLPYPLTDNERLVEILADLLEEPREDVRLKLYQVEQSPTKYLATAFAKTGIEPYTWCNELEDFYRHTDIYLTGGIVWNRKPYKVELRKWIANFLRMHCVGSQKILTVGDGVGFDSLYLSQCGHDVTYSELSEKCIRFARKVFALAKEPVKVIDDLSEIEPASYDLVLCLDVLEHLPDPNQLVEQIAGYLRPGGLFIVHAPFYYVSPENPTHLDSNRQYSGDIRTLYGRHGFSLLDGRLFWDPLVLVKSSPPAPATTRKGIWKGVLYAVGMLLAVGRVWCGPHNMVASLLAGRGESRWLAGLQAKQLIAESEKPQDVGRNEVFRSSGSDIW